MKFESFDAEYVRRLTNGDPEVEDHFASYFTNVLDLKLRVRLHTWQSIDDVKQETLARVLTILRQGEGVKQPERFGAFVSAVCNNVIREQQRFEGRYDPLDEQAEESADSTVDLDAPLVHDDLRREIEQIMRELPEKDSSILRAVYLQEMDKEEVCRRHQVDAGYLRVILHRAKVRFRVAYLGERDGLPPFIPNVG